MSPANIALDQRIEELAMAFCITQKFSVRRRIWKRLVAAIESRPVAQVERTEREKFGAPLR